MSSRTITISGTSTTDDLLIEPADIYIATDGLYASAVHFGLTTEEIAISITYDYAVYMQDGAVAARRRVMTAGKLAFSFGEQGDIDKMAVALGVSSIDTTTPGWEKIFFNSNNTEVPDYLFIVRSQFVSGKQFEFVMWKGQVLSPEDLNMGMPSGSTDFSNYNVNVEALKDPTRTSTGNDLFEFAYAT